MRQCGRLRHGRAGAGSASFAAFKIHFQAHAHTDLRRRSTGYTHTKLPRSPFTATRAGCRLCISFSFCRQSLAQFFARRPAASTGADDRIAGDNVPPTSMRLARSRFYATYSRRTRVYDALYPVASGFGTSKPPGASNIDSLDARRFGPSGEKIVTPSARSSENAAKATQRQRKLRYIAHP